jgi:DNA-binding HxlR family transcriptional regulator
MRVLMGLPRRTEENETFHPATDPLLRPARGEGFLALLADVRTVELMEAVRDATLAREELITRLEFGGSAFDRRMSQLTQMGVIVTRPTPRDHRRREYRLAHNGRDLLEIGEELAQAAASLAQNGRLNALLVKVVADPWDRTIVRVLLEAPQQFNELLRLAHGTWRPDGAGRSSTKLTPAGLSLRLERLEQLGLVSRLPAPRRGAALYGLDDCIWRLGRVALRSALWRWRWTPACVPRMAGDLPALVRMLAPRVRAVDEEEIRVVLHVDTPPGRDGWPDVVVSLIDGRMTVPELTLSDPQARTSATPSAWCEAMLSGEFDAVAIEGDAASARTVLTGLASALDA